jgi:hypothetical protein
MRVKISSFRKLTDQLLRRLGADFVKLLLHIFFLLENVQFKYAKMPVRSDQVFYIMSFTT